MFGKLAAAALALWFFGPAAALLGVGVLMNPAAAHCALPAATVNLGGVPDSLTATTANSHTFTLNQQQLTHAATIITIGKQTHGVGRAGVKIALMAALTESTLRMLTNTSAYPESARYPNDGDGSDHDSLGLFQMRPTTGWGTVAELMDPTYQARAFFGGPTGPNHPSPRGLLDIPGWQQMDLGEAAQAVEVSAYPDRYRNYEPVAEAILAALTTDIPATSSAGTGGEPTDPPAWPVTHDPAELPTPSTSPPAACGDQHAMPGAPGLVEGGVEGDPDRLLADPTSTGQITARMAHLYQQTLVAFPRTSWACWSPRPGTTSDHPLGRACDVTFGNNIGERPTPTQRQLGWHVTNWIQRNATTLGVDYLIWDGLIWSLNRDAEGWRPYNGGGMHNPDSITDSHRDHLHISVR